MNVPQRIIWKCWFVGTLIAVAGYAPPRTLAAEESNRPNVLFLLTDDQRADTIAALGNSVSKTPKLDRLAKSGFVFRNAYCMGSTMAAVCNPSRHMLHSGLSLFRYDPNKKNDTLGDVFRQHLHDYYGCISSIDFNIGRIFRTRQELGEFENTIIVFSSDHGLAIGSHGLFGKQNVYEHILRQEQLCNWDL